MTTEMTALRKTGARAEAFAAAMLRTCPDCIKTLSSDGRITFMSTNGLCAMEIEAEGDVIGRFWWDLWPAEQRPSLKQAFETAKRTGVGRHTGYCPTGKGTRKLWEVRITVMEAAAGSPPSILAISRDVTHFG